MSPLRVITVASNKGGVGKTTVSTNLAIYLRALREDLPVLLLGLDDQDLIQRMFTLEPSAPTTPGILDALRAGALAPAIRLGQYGVHYIPPSPTLSGYSPQRQDPMRLRRLLCESGWRGIVVIDTKGDLGPLTESALAASDLALLVVADRSSLDQAERIYERLDAWQRPRGSARILLSLVDQRVKYTSGDAADILSLLLTEIRARGHACLATFLSRSPKIEGLQTNRDGRVHSILHGARSSLVHRQMTQLANDVLALLGEAREAAPAPQPAGLERRLGVRRPYSGRVACFSAAEPPILALRGRDLSQHGIAVEPNDDITRAGRVRLLLDPGDPALLVWAHVVRRDDDRTALRFEIGEKGDLARRVKAFVAGLAPAA